MLQNRNAKKVTLTQEDANRILSNVFAQMQTEPNAVPLGVLESYSNYRIERFALQKFLVSAIMILFLLLPILFIAPSVEITKTTSSFSQIPSYHISVNALIPIQRIMAQIDGRNVPVYEVGTHQYEIQPTANGEMEICVTLVNKQEVTHTVTVGDVDLDPPKLLGNDYDENHLTLYFADDASGLDLSGAYATGISGSNIPTTNTNLDSGAITFPYPTETMNVFVPDKAGNTLQLVISLKQKQVSGDSK